MAVFPKVNGKLKSYNIPISAKLEIKKKNKVIQSIYTFIFDSHNQTSISSFFLKSQFPSQNEDLTGQNKKPKH